jgi:hypothetical protein
MFLDWGLCCKTLIPHRLLQQPAHAAPTFATRFLQLFNQKEVTK